MRNLINYLNNSISPYHAVKYAIEKLADAGFKKLDMKDDFNLEEGGMYYVSPYPTSLFAFTVAINDKEAALSKQCDGIRIACAHTDFPAFKIKLVPDISAKTAGVNRINTEPYGGMLKRTWFDRPLSIAGVVMLRTDDELMPKEILFDSKKPWAYIPSLAPHMDRDIEKKEVDVAKEMLPLICINTDDNSSFIELLARSISDDTGMQVDAKDILSFDLNLYDAESAGFVGYDEAFLSSSRIDNIASVAALVDALIDSKNNSGISLIALFDNEEIGSRSKQGADSNLLNWVIKKICESSYALSHHIDYKNLLLGGMMLSVDGAHAKHPNYPEKADAEAVAELGKGFVIKTSASQRYVTDPRMIAIVKGICDKKGISYQLQANKSGTPGGQTLGPIASSYLPIPAIDMGVPMLGMHSIREMIARTDYDSLALFIKEFLDRK